MFHLLRFPVCCKQIQNANLKSCYYLVCLSCTYSCYDYAGAINAMVSMFQYLYEANTSWGGKSENVLSAYVTAGYNQIAFKLLRIIGNALLLQEASG